MVNAQGKVQQQTILDLVTLVVIVSVHKEEDMHPPSVCIYICARRLNERTD
jgi:hypothetical protein